MLSLSRVATALGSRPALARLLGIVLAVGMTSCDSPTEPTAVGLKKDVRQENVADFPTLIHGLTITGKVTGEADKPISGKVVRAAVSNKIFAADPGNLIANGTTDKDGRFELVLKEADVGGAPFDPRQAYGKDMDISLHVERGDGYEEKSLNLKERLVELIPSGTGKIIANVILPDANITLDRIVNDLVVSGTTNYTRESGSLRPGDGGITVEIIGGDPRYVGRTTRTDPQGKFEFELKDVGEEPFEIHLEARKAGYYSSAHYAARGTLSRSRQQPNPAYGPFNPAVLQYSPKGGSVASLQSGAARAESGRTSGARNAVENGPQTLSVTLNLVMDFDTEVLMDGALGIVGGCGDRVDEIVVPYLLVDEEWETADLEWKAASGFVDNVNIKIDRGFGVLRFSMDAGAGAESEEKATITPVAPPTAPSAGKRFEAESITCGCSSAEE